MNIGIVTTWFERGAAYVSRAYEQTLSTKHSVYIYARGGEKYAKHDPIWHKPNVTYAPRLNNIFFQGHSSMSRIHFYNWIKKHNIQLLFFNEQHDISIVRLFSQLGVLTGAYVDYYTAASIRDFDSYDFLICNTKRHYSVFKHHRNCLFVQWGTDTDLYKPPSIKDEHSHIKFFHSAGFGGINCRKGTDLLVKAFQKVAGPAKLIIHSQVPPSNYGKDVENIIRKDVRILFMEKTVPAPGLYHLGDVYVYPSRLDGIGLSVPEALSCGLPVITSDAAPMNEFIANDYNGFLVSIKRTNKRFDNYYWPETIVDEDDLANKMQSYVNNYDLVTAHSINARLSALNSFDWRKNSHVLCESVDNLRCISGPGRLSPLFYGTIVIEDTVRLLAFFVGKPLSILKLLLNKTSH